MSVSLIWNFIVKRIAIPGATALLGKGMPQKKRKYELELLVEVRGKGAGRV